MRKPRQINFDELHKQKSLKSWGGYRPGAGRKPIENPPIHHVRRGRVPSGQPAHVILRVRRGIPSLRNGRFLKAWRQSLVKACQRDGFRVVHYSVQSNHVHFLVEAPGGKEALARGMMAVGQRFARCVNRVFGRRGPVLFGRYNVKLLTCPRQVRNALAYVLLNVRKHRRESGRALAAPQIDPCSSGRWFDGWKPGEWRPPPTDPCSEVAREVAPARSWLLTRGWRKWRLLSMSEVPGC